MYTGAVVVLIEYQDNAWEPPRPNPWGAIPYQDPQRIFLDDVFHELSALISQRPLMEKKGNQDEYTLQPARDELLLAVDAFDCGYPVNIRKHNILIDYSDIKAPRREFFQMAPAPLVFPKSGKHMDFL